jgi:hypothetical protein
MEHAQAHFGTNLREDSIGGSPVEPGDSLEAYPTFAQPLLLLEAVLAKARIVLLRSKYDCL